MAAAWTLNLIEREDGRYTFNLIRNIIPPVTYAPQEVFVNRDRAIEAAGDMRDLLTGAETRASASFDFDPV